MDIEAMILGGSYLAIFALMVANGFFSFPSSQVLYILVGYFVGTGFLALIPGTLVGALGNTVGNIALYELVRAKGIVVVKKFHMFREEDLRRVEILFRTKGVWFLFVGKLLPAIKVFVPIPAGLAKVHRALFATLMFASSWIWSFIFVGIGYSFGKGAELWKSYGIILMVVALIVLFAFYRLLYSPLVTKELLAEDAKHGAHTPGQ